MYDLSKPTRFLSPKGIVLVAVPAKAGDWPHQTKGWYGGVDEATYERSGLSCCARYYFDADVALLGEPIDS